MSISTLDQLHADRTARLSSARRLRLPSFRPSLFARKERRRSAASLATSC